MAGTGIVDFSGAFASTTGEPGYSADGGPASEAQLTLPQGIALDSEGNLYIADTENHGVHKVDSEGVIRTVAGTGIAGFSGDGGRAFNAQLWKPADVAIDRDGNLYIADSLNNRIRKVDTTGFISTVAGNGRQGSGGDGGPATLAELMRPYAIEVDDNGNIYVVGRDNRVRKITF